MQARSLAIDGFEEAHELRLAGTVAFVAVAHAAGGRAFGGIRIRAYETERQGLEDALALARAMARKVALAGIAGGGAKTVVIEPHPARRAEAMAELGAFIESLGGRYQCGPDYGFTAADEAILRKATSHVAHGDLAAGTAESVARTMAAAAGPMKRVVIQGVGGVGRLLAERLRDQGVEVAAADIRPLEGWTGIQAVAPERVYDEACDVFAPCAVGGVLGADTIARLRCRVVCGAANNPLAGPEDADRLRDRGIVYVPDVLANAGATIVGASCALGEEQAISGRMDALVALASDVLARAAREGRSPHHVAMEIADARVEALRRGAR
jgi:leucine dehydrogenase